MPTPERPSSRHAASQAPAVIPLAEPLSLPGRPELTGGARIGVLLSHGFTGSPWSLADWGRALNERGYAVEVPRLPGHGTTWQDLNRHTWADWYAELTRVFEDLRSRSDAVVLCGLSMGGGLALQLAADHADDVSGVVLVNPAVSTRRLDVKLLPVLKHLFGAFPGIANDIKKPGVEEIAYPRTPLKAAHSMMRAWPGVVASLPRVTAPILYFRSTIDHVVDASSEPLITGGVASTDVTVRKLTESFHVATVDNDADTIVGESADFIARVTASARRAG